MPQRPIPDDAPGSRHPADQSLFLMSPSGEVLITVKEYAALTRQTEETVRQSIRSGQFRWPIERDTPRGAIRIRVTRAWVATLNTPAA